MNVVITGGLGYIASALIELYRDEKNVTVTLIDKEFIPQRLVTLKKLKHFKYVQADILDEEKIKPYLEKADLVYHFAGLIEAESSVAHPEETMQVNYYGTQVVSSLISEKCHLVFASTANVFGGKREDEVHKGLTEESEVATKYPYAESKVAAENWIIENVKSYTICRFGTAYGYSDGIRFNLVSNLFVKQVLQGQPITIFGKGDNYRPFTHVHDLARAAQFLGEKKEQGTFHVVGENFTINEFADEVIKNLGKGEIRHEEKPSVFDSYHLSSPKLRGLGFKFRKTVGNSTREMRELFEVINV